MSHYIREPVPVSGQPLNAKENAAMNKTKRNTLLILTAMLCRGPRSAPLMRRRRRASRTSSSFSWTTTESRMSALKAAPVLRDAPYRRTRPRRHAIHARICGLSGVQSLAGQHPAGRLSATAWHHRLPRRGNRRYLRPTPGRQTVRARLCPAHAQGRPHPREALEEGGIRHLLRRQVALGRRRIMAGRLRIRHQ